VPPKQVKIEFSAVSEWSTAMSVTRPASGSAPAATLSTRVAVQVPALRSMRNKRPVVVPAHSRVLDANTIENTRPEPLGRFTQVPVGQVLPKSVEK